MTTNVIVLVILLVILAIFTAPWKYIPTATKTKKKKDVDPKSSEYFDQREIEAKRIQEDLKAKANGVKKRENPLKFEPVIKTKKTKKDN